MVKEEIPSLADTPLGTRDKQLLRGLRLLLVLFVVVGAVAMFLPDHLEFCPNCDDCSNPEWTGNEHNSFVHTGQAVGSFIALFLLLGISLATLQVKPSVMATAGWTLVLVAPFLILLMSGSPILRATTDYWSDRLVGHQLMGLSVAALYCASVLGPIIRASLHWSARRELMRRLELPRATIKSSSP